MAEFHRDVPDFLSRVEGPVPEGRVRRLPTAEDVSIPVQPHLIVEFVRSNHVAAVSALRRLPTNAIFVGAGWNCPASVELRPYTRR